MIYLLNTPVITAYGEFRFTGPIDPSEARLRLIRGFTSAVGHAGSAMFLSRILDVDVPMHRTSITMQPGDQALVLRLRPGTRLPEGKVLTAAELAAVPYELGWLERTA